MKLSISEAAKLSGVSVRTLHYYDSIGLLSPTEILDNGYRFYHDVDLVKLQQILFLKEMDFPLKEISYILSLGNYDAKEVFHKQKQILTLKRDRLNRLIQLLEKSLEGDFDMSFKEFDKTEIEKKQKEYEKEVRQRYGKTDAFEEYEKKTANYSKDKWAELQSSGEKIMKEFSQVSHLSLGEEQVQNLVEKWRNYISENFYECSKEVLLGLADLYVLDERFTKNIDQFGAGTAEFMSKAIKFYCKK